MSNFVLSETVVTVNESDIEIVIEKGAQCVIRPVSAKHTWKTLLDDGYTDGDVIEALLSNYLEYVFYDEEGDQIMSGVINYTDLPNFVKLNGLEVVSD